MANSIPAGISRNGGKFAAGGSAAVVVSFIVWLVAQNVGAVDNDQVMKRLSAIEITNATQSVKIERTQKDVEKILRIVSNQRRYPRPSRADPE